MTAEIVADLPRSRRLRTQLAQSCAVRMVAFASTDHVFGVELHRGPPTLSAATQARVGAVHATLSGEFARILPWRRQR